MTAVDHQAAVMALLNAGMTPYPALDEPAPPDLEPPYQVAYFADNDPEDAESRSLAGRSERYVMRITLHSVGETAVAALAVAQRGRAALLDVVSIVPGRTCFPIRREEGQPVRPKEGTGSETHTKTDVYRLESVPA
jgi:hypothetical protein